MPIYALDNATPTIDPQAFVHPDAVVIGAVELAAGVSVWPGAVLRGDEGLVIVGERTSVQDGTIVHTTEEHPTVIGADCVVGHRAHLEGCVVEDGCLIGSGSLVLNRARVAAGAVVAAAALVLEDMTVPAGALAIGVPASIRARRAGASSHGSGTRSRPIWTSLSGTAPDCAGWTGLPPRPARARRSKSPGRGKAAAWTPRERPRGRRCPHDPATVRCLPGHAGNHSPCAPGGKRRFLDVRSHPCGSRGSAETFRGRATGRRVRAGSARRAVPTTEPGRAAGGTRWPPG